MSKILGLDLGVASIGWALIDENEKQKAIIDMGSRIIPYSDTEGDDFSKGTGESKNQQRTFDRTARKVLDRYQLRRKQLIPLLKSINALPGNDLIEIPALELFKLRARAVTEKLSLPELGRILLHLNQRRGYKHGSEDEGGDKKQRDYVAAINTRYASIKGKQTIGQFFYDGLLKAKENNTYYRIKEQIFPREAYKEEFDTIWQCQAKEYPGILTDDLMLQIRDEIIYYQRPLKSQKGLVSICEFEGFWVKDKEGKELYTGPRVAPKSSPIFQLTKIWESINTISVKRVNTETKKPEEFNLQPFTRKIFDYLNRHKNMSEAELFTITGIKKNDGYYTPVNIRKKGIQGNLTVAAILEALDGYEGSAGLLQFDLTEETAGHLNKETGELTTIQQIAADCEKQPLYQLWHLCYSVKDKAEKTKALINKFSLPPNYAEALAVIDFTKGGFGNKSAKAMRRILPLLVQGFVYSNAMALAGYNHSDSETKEQSMQRELKAKLSLLPKNSLRQPVAEKILNQMINLVNSIIAAHGMPDEIRVELARELKQSKDERNDYFNAISQRNKQSEKIAARLEKEYGVKGNRRNIEKWRLWHEVNGKCLYCNSQITLTQFLKGIESDVEHIIPKSIFFDDSFSNKTIAHTACNKEKDNTTAFDFMNQKSSGDFDTYLENLNTLYKNEKSDNLKTDEGPHCLTGKISGTKFKRLQWRKEDIPQDFINRQLNETRFIAKKAIEILRQVCRKVYSTSGNVTETLRTVWGWGQVLENLQIEKYRKHGQTEIVEFENNGYKHKKERIKGWNKRNDHRHHAIDALVVACTKQGFIQRLNTLSASGTKDGMRAEMDAASYEYDKKKDALENYFFSQKPFTTNEVEINAAKIFVSFKAGKRVATISKFRATGQNLKTGIIVPRGALSEASVYGKIKTIGKDIKKNEIIKYPVKYLFEHPGLIFKPRIKKLVQERIAHFNGDNKLALASLKKEPVYLDDKKTIELKYASCYTEEVVIKYPITSIAAKDVEYIVDEKIKNLVKDRLAAHGNKEKEAFKTPLFFDGDKTRPILSVRCFTGLSAVETVKKDINGNDIGFVLPKNNHHIALYKNSEGEIVESASTFWHCVERKAFFMKYFSKEERNAIQENTIITQPGKVWDKILELKDTELSDGFKEKLPLDDWEYITSLQRNEMFVIGLNDAELADLIKTNQSQVIAEYLYRVNAIAPKNYQFRLHTETKVDDKYDGIKNEMLSKTLGKLVIIQSIDKWKERNPIKVKINLLGKIEIVK
jgi:CRISPR-associated endonuclease Csn1